MQVPQTDGVAWFKVANPGPAFEAGLLEALGDLDRERVLRPWAVERDRV